MRCSRIALSVAACVGSLLGLARPVANAGFSALNCAGESLAAAVLSGGRPNAASPEAAPPRGAPEVEPHAARVEAGARPREDSSLSGLLALLGLSVADLRLDPEEMGLWGGSPQRLPVYDLFRADPSRLEPYARSFRNQALEAAGSAGGILAFTAWKAGLPVRRGLVESADLLPQWKSFASTPGALAEALIGLRGNGKPLPSSEEASLRAACGKVPQQAAAPAALMLRAIASAMQWREAALSPLGEAKATLATRAVAAIMQGDSPTPDLSLVRSLERDAGRIDLRRLLAGAEDLARAADSAAEMLADPGVQKAGPFSFRFETPLGAVLLRGTGNDRLEPREGQQQSVLLLIDLGGDDTYETAGVGPEISGIQVWIDAAGNDTYRSALGEIGAFGAGVAGYGLLLDLGGNDTYAAGPVSLGAGLYGFGVLEDRGGQDVYRSAEFTQGAGAFGAGVLADLEGKDEYHAAQMAQGFGGVAGAGLLVDRIGDDLYEISDPARRHPSMQAPGHGASLAQGCGQGNRADYIDGHSQAGGIGMLFDGAGNDTYVAEVFAQGCGYWYGTGLLSDAGGDDSYQAVWYAQGASAHFAIGFLLDESGSDRYRTTMNMAQGAGHDFSFGGLIDVSGNDRYDAPNLSLGAGNDNGIGLFWDRGGDDVYEAAGLTLGRSAITTPRGGPRDLIKCVGVFLDTGGGKDTYGGSGASAASNGSVWKQQARPGSSLLSAEIGAGLDR